MEFLNDSMLDYSSIVKLVSPINNENQINQIKNKILKNQKSKKEIKLICNHCISQVHSNMKYIGMGYMPCNGYVPCQPDHLDSSSTINTSLIPGKRRRTRGMLVK